jgi:hypothetical protein
LQSFVVTGFTILLAVEFKDPALVVSQPLWLWIAKALLLIIMMAGNYFGGEVLFNTVSKEFRASKT